MDQNLKLQFMAPDDYTADEFCDRAVSGFTQRGCPALDLSPKYLEFYFEMMAEMIEFERLGQFGDDVWKSCKVMNS